jgi:hypothetical protein
MSNIFSQGMDTAYQRRIEQITAECKSQNIELVDVKGLVLREVNEVKSTLGSAVTSFVGGKAQYEYLQIYTMRQGSDLQYFFQPFSGLTALPGQHFKVIPGSLRYPIQYGIKKKKSFSDHCYEFFMDHIPGVNLKKIRACEFLSEAESETSNLKRQNLPVLKEVSHVWQNGTTLINLDWTFQACAINQDITLVSMQTGRYGIFSEKSGLSQFNKFCFFVSSYAKHLTGDGSSNVLITNSFLSYIFKKYYLNGKTDNLWGESIEWLQTNKVKLIVEHLKKFDRLKKLHLNGDINEKKMANLKECILNKYGVSSDEVIAAVPMDLLGNMKGAAVLTADKLYISDGDEYECCIDLDNVSDYNGLKGFTESTMELAMADGSTTEVKIELASEVMNAFFTQYCYL